VIEAPAGATNRASAVTRRQFFAGAAALAMSAAGDPAWAGDEAYWARVAADFDIALDPVPLENGNWGVMSRPVLQAYLELTRSVNRRNTAYARDEYPADLERVRSRVASALGVDAAELALTRNATESLQGLIAAYGGLRAGDEVLIADLDYPAMQSAMRWLHRERGVGVVEIALPEPATYDGLIEAYDKALTVHPKVKLMLLTHLGHRTGLVLPVREIVERARARGVDAIVDSAHAFGQLNVRIPDLGADFVGFNLHKWFGAPIGCGALYVARHRLPDMQAHMAESAPLKDIRQLVYSGTMNFAALLAVPAALDYHAAIGAGRVEARLRHLRRSWVEPLRGRPGLQMLTPPDERLAGGIAAFRLEGRRTDAENAAISRWLRQEFGIMTVHRTGAAGGACVRVSPAIFTTPEHIERLVQALRTLSSGVA
jgi:selenocysteine lyase/cysteine desulfurase